MVASPEFEWLAAAVCGGHGAAHWPDRHQRCRVAGAGANGPAITFATHHSVVIVLLSHHFPGRPRGRGQALYTVIGYGFSGVLGSLGGGVLSAKYGLDGVFVAAEAMGFIAFGCAWQVWSLQDWGRGD